MPMRKVAIIGGGPIGLEAALEAKGRGFDVAVYERDRVGGHLRRFGHVALFTPFWMNSTEAGRARLRDTGASLPDRNALLTASDLVERYLAPLSRLPELRDSIHEGSRVTHVGREGVTKTRGIVAVGDRSRTERPFLIRVECSDGATRFDQADLVFDASGVFGTPNAMGAGGLPAAGEERLGDRVERHIPDLAGSAKARYGGAQILLVGDGHSAATALAQWDDLARGGSGGGAEVHWVHRDRAARGIYDEIPDDALPARRDLVARANAIARSAPWLTRHPGATIRSFANGPGARVRATLHLHTGAERVIEVDRVLALVGYRPDVEIYRELQVHLCYASEAPMKLASAILTAGLAAPEGAGDCLSQVSHGPESLESPEPGFFILGAKSYGRNASFLLTIGHRQVLDALSLVGPEGAAFAVAPPGTGRTMIET